MQCSNGFRVVSRWAVLLFGGLAVSVALPGAQEERGSALSEAAILGMEEPRAADAQALFARFSQMRGLEVSFHEKKHLALLAIPLESRGKLYFLPPGHLTRIVESPRPSRLTIGPKELRMVDADGEEVIDLGANAELDAFITSLVRVFSGDREGLERSYHIDYALDAKDDARWSLTLSPRQKPLTEMLRRLRLEGAGTAVLRIEMTEPNGDRTVTEVKSADPRREFTELERREWFGLTSAQPR